VEAFISETGKVYSNDEDFVNLPESKSVKEARPVDVLEVKYKFSKSEFSRLHSTIFLRIGPVRTEGFKKPRAQQEEMTIFIKMYKLTFIFAQIMTPPKVYFRNPEPFLLNKF